MRKPLIILGIIIFFSLFSLNARADITNLSYKFPVDTNATIANLVFSVNDTYGLGGNILWTQNKAGLYAYCSVLDCSSGVMGIGNLTSELNWENESSGLGSNPTDVWESSLVAVYHFGNGLNDSTANDNDAGYRDVATASFIPGVFGNAIDFNPAVVGYDGSGTNGLALPSSITDDLWISTIEFWYMPNDSTSDYQGMLGIFGDSSNKFQLFYGITDGKINVYFKVGGAVKIPSVDIATTLTAGQWYHIAIVFDSTDFKLYVNGSLADGLTYACTNLLKDIAPSADTTFGSVYDGAYYNAKGAFDEIKLYNRSLSQTEVQEHFYNGLPDNLTDVSTTPPAIFSVDLVSPSNGYALPSNLTAIFSYIPTSNVSLTKCVLLNNDTSWSMKQENQSVIANDTVNTITYIHSSYGWYKWNINCTDIEGKQNMSATNFTYHLTDSVPPSVSLSFPSNGAVVAKGIINFTYIPTDNWGFYKAELSMNGTVYETVTISDNARFSTYYNTPFPYMYDMYPEAYHYEGVYNRTYFVWSAGSVTSYPMIRYYDHTSKTWSLEYNISTVAPQSSDYSEPVLQINGSGYIFVEYRNESERTMAYYVSDNPEDITAFTHIGIVATEGGYPQFHKFDNGTFYMLFAYKRDVVTGQTDEGEILSYDNIHWTDARVILNCTTEYYPYGTAFHGTSYMDSDNNIYEVWGVNRGGAEEFWDESLMYAYRTYNDSNWRNFTGDIQPINENESMKCGNIVVYNSSLTSDPVHIVRGVVKLDSIKRPNIVFYGMRDGGRNESYWHTGYNGTEWVTTLITNVSNSEFTNGVSDSIVYYEINSTDGQEVYLPLSQSATYGAGVLVKYFSTDNGTTWIFDKVIDGNISGIPKDIYNGTASGMKFVYGIGTSEETSQAKLYGLNFPAWKKVASNASAITNDSVNTISYSVDVSGDYVWNVNITDLYGNSVFATGNYTLYVVDSIPPLPSGCLNSTFSYARNLTIANADSQRINELTGIYVSDLCNPRSDCASDLHDVRLYEDGVQKDWQCFNENNYTRCDSPDAVMIRFLANADTSGIYNNYQFCFNASVDNDTGYDTNLGIYWEDNFENRTSGFSKWNSGVLTAGAGTVTINTTGGYSYLSSHSAEMKGGTSNYAQLHTEGDTKTQGRIQFFMKNLIPLSSSYNNLLIIVNDGGWSDWGWLGMVNEAFPNAVTGMATNGSSIIWHSGGHSEYVSPVSCDGVWCLYTLETNSSGSFMWVNQTVLVSSAPYLTSWDTDLYFSTGASGGYGEDDFLIDDFMWTDSGTVVNRYLTPAVVAVGAKEGALPEYPIVILNQPSNGGTFSNSFIVPLNFTVTSNTSITGCDVWSNKTGSWAYLASNSSAILNDTMMTVNGTFTSIGAIQWAVNCTDSNGNKRASSNYTFTIIDTQSPYEVNLVSPADGSSTNDTTPDFTFNFIDNMSLTGSATLYLNDTSDGFTTIAPTLKGMSAMNRNIPCINSSATNWQTKCYYFGGHNGTSTVESFVINISDGAWYHIADYPNAITGLNSMPMVDGERILVEYDDTTQHYTNIYYILNDSYHALPNVPVTGSPGCANNENSIAFRGKDLDISSEYDDLYYYVGGGGYNGCDEMHIWNDTDSTWLTGDDIDLDGLVGIEASSYFVANHTVYSIGGTGHNSSGGGSDQDWGCIKWTPITPINGTWAHCTDPPADYENKFINNYFGYYADKFHLFGGYNRSQSANGIHDSWWKHLVFYWQNETYEVARNNTFALGGGVSANLGDGTFIFAMNYNAIGGYFDYNTTAFEYVSSDFDIWVDYGSNSSVLNATNTIITANQNLIENKTYKWYIAVTDESGNNAQSGIRTFTVSSAPSGNAPQIIYVEGISPVNPTEGATTAFTINFTAYDADGVGDLNFSGYSMTITGETNPAITRTDTSCVNYENGTNTASFTCTFSLNYYDDPQNYRVNVSIHDNEGNPGYNDSISFTYNELKAWTMSPSSITYGSLNCGIGAPQGATDDPMVLNNTGNANITNVTVKAYDLIGQSDGSWIINSSYFTVNTVDSSGGDVMLNDTYVQIASSKIPFGQGSTESLFYWIEALPCPLKGQSYQSTWEISGA